MIKAEWKNIAKSTWLKIVLCAIMIIPMIYACVFLGSMWDPYGQTDQLPVAVVNKDKEVEYNDSTMDIGKQLSDKLSKNDSMDFNIVSSTKAQKGLKDGKYYMIITIPENFSKNATTLLDDDPQTMMLTYTTNPQTNYIATKMDDSAMAKVKTEISSTVTKTYSKILFKNVKTLSKGFNTAADGSQKLSDGVATASEGNKTITENLNTLASSALVFNDGADSLVKGLSAYTEGVSTAKAGAQQLDNNSATLNNGAAQLKSGSSQLLSAVKAAEKQLSDGLNQNAEQLNTLTQKNNEMNESSKQLSQALTQIQAGIDNNNLVENNLQAAKKLDSIVSVMTTAIGTMNTNADKLDKLAAAEKAKAESIQATQPLLAQQLMLQATSHATQAQTLRQVASQLINQVNTSDLKQLTTLLYGNAEVLKNQSTANAKTQELLAGSQQLATANNSAVNSLVSNLKTVQANMKGTSNSVGMVGAVSQIDEGLGTLQSGLKTYTGGVKQVNNGLGTLASNNKTLNSGASQLADGALKISSGSNQLAAGSATLGEGLTTIGDGTNTLTSSLKDASKKSNIKSTNKTYKQMSTPVDTQKKEITNMPNNGHAMAPYMMSVALYVACMALSLMYPFGKGMTTTDSPVKFLLAKATVMVPLSIVQALILYFSLRGFCGFTPARPGLCIAFMLLLSLAFMAFIAFLAIAFGRIGEFIALIFMVFNLGASAGTYPLETAPHWYTVLHPFVPFTYSVNGFRSVIANATAVPTTEILFFIGLLVVSVLLTYLIVRHRSKTHKVFLPEVFNGEC
ncbi:YhgE/Pip domain-containing protein [Catenibacterium mitsuokai]|uniref:YhgE/Pip domain-containing protein n=1 Tax=Catenibacterium mitsuokai TaxID=100886 RepID=A0AAW4MRP8_9FIRM|nr:YhgE/Pip domain-containing protein [Catenibacterium mitsuokai]MBV3366070.1 YhgE/Pip domain-containing protein [Catenibacterium mitsuokai]MBV3370204.1 YhgE/Pip domain-containing protein [Catenibacterium mitsuokai]MBV3375497.1 YhgE/Pip domain-containing protein [Catenibacterium mitsuokai]MBV3378524.1 YhgE/Pip domain-containing protein [Catenibacterium mitsuokai]MBV3380080.1 YhgE/Pip domain-containing protein [Catenibacterium mitsuokai]